MNFQQNVNLSLQTSWRTGGAAEYFVQPSTPQEVGEAQRWAIQHQRAITVLGGGTNVLVSDRGISGLVISLKKLTGWHAEQKNNQLAITALAGTPKMLLMKAFLKHGLSPARLLSGIPGQVGGGVVMNAGLGHKSRPKDFSEIVEGLWVCREGEEHFVPKEKLCFEYRHTQGWQPGIIIKVKLSWSLSDVCFSLEDLRAEQMRRKRTQPLEWPSGGSVFKNPSSEVTAGRCIQECGLKGFQIGGAQISPRHANFIVNLGEAKSRDIAKVIAHVKRVVLEKMGVSLSCEVHFLGDWS